MPSMSGYTKLFSSILASTIWEADMPTRIVWITLLAMADRHGIAEGSIPGLATFARVTVEQARKAVAALESPDPESRSQEQDGRRIERVDGGWRLVNHGKYRAKLSEDERREYFKERKRIQRASKKSKTVQDESNLSPDVTQAEAEAEASPKARNVRTHAANDDETVERVRRFVDLFRDLHQQYCGVAYLGNPQKDYQAACELVAAFDDGMLEKLAVFGLNDSDPFMAKGTRTLTKLKSRASDYAQQLKAKRLA